MLRPCKWYRERGNRGQNYLQALKDLGASDVLKRGVHLEVGSGWHLTIPLLFYVMGCNKQLLVDINRNAREDLVFPVANLLSHCKFTGERPIRKLPDTSHHDLESYLSQVGIEYLAPTKGKLPVPDESVSVITMTSVLEYISRSKIRELFEDVKRALKPGGYFLAWIDMIDQFNFFDHTISRFNFLRYSEKTWKRWYCNKFQTINRMRPSDYQDLFEGLPFRTMAWEIERPSRFDFKELGRIKVSPDFAGYSSEDLASRSLFFAMKRE